MAKLHLSRLIKKYDFSASQVKGANYRRLMKDVLANNSENIARATGRLSQSHWDKALKKVKRAKRRQFIIPNVEETLPKRSVFLKKAAVQGNLITDTLRDRLTENLRSSLENFRTKKTDEPSFIRRRGTKAGTINPQLSKQFLRDITKTFESYTKTDPAFGIPGNIKTIAVTEMRSTINEMKHTYNQELMRKNPDIEMRKRWQQNKKLAAVPRKGHMIIHGVEIAMSDDFNVPLYASDGKKIGTTKMKRPHDPNAPLEQVAGCNCDIVYFASIL